MSGNRDGLEQQDENVRLDRLDERLARAEAAEAERTGANRPQVDANQRLGNRVLAELVGGMAGGALIGWLADRLLDTSPWGLLVMLALGTIVAFRNIIRLSSGSGQR